jgi:hypothetical protein
MFSSELTYSKYSQASGHSSSSSSSSSGVSSSSSRNSSGGGGGGGSSSLFNDAFSVTRTIKRRMKR